MEALGGQRHIVLYRGYQSPYGKGVGKTLPIVLYLNTTVLAHSPDGATADAAIAKLEHLCLLNILFDFADVYILAVCKYRSIVPSGLKFAVVCF